MSKVRWSQKECESVVLEAVELFRDKGGRRKLDALKEAQSILPPERHKRALTTTLKRTLLERLERALAVPPLTPPEPPPPPPEPPPPPPPTLQELPLVALVQELISRVTSIVVDLKAEVAAIKAERAAQQLGAPQPQLRHAPEEVKPKLPRVLIAGLLPAQCEEISREFEGRIALRFAAKNCTVRHLKKMAPATDHTIGMINFIGHAQDRALRAHAKEYHSSPGGMTTLKTQLKSILSA